MRRNTLALTLATAGLAAALTGCAGQGKRNQEFASQAESKVNAIKAASEFEMARQAFLAGSLEKALKSIDRSLKQNPTVPASHVLRARIYNEMGRLGDALDSLQLAKINEEARVDLEPRADIHYYEGVILERLQRPNAAFEAYSRAAELEPTSEQYAIARTEVLIDLGRYEEAERTLVKSTDRFENSAAVQQTLGRLALLNGHNDNAVKLFREARLLSPDDSIIVEDLVEAQIRTGRFAEAEHNLSRLLSRPNMEARRDLKLLQARCLIELDRPMEARSILNDLAATDLGSGDPHVWIAMGRASIAMADEKRLREAADRAVGLAPDNGEAHLLAAMSARIDADLDTAFSHAFKATELDPSDASAFTMLGLIEMERGNGVAARDAFARAMNIDSTNTSLNRLIAAMEEQGTETFASVDDN